MRSIKCFMLFSFLIVFSFTSLLFAQAPDTLWTRTFGGTDDDQGWGAVETIDGGYLIGGWTFSFGAGNQDIYLMKLDSLGSTEWQKTIGGADTDVCRSVQLLNSGDYILAGRTSSWGSGSNDALLLYINQNGDTVWTKTMGSSGDDRGNSAKEAIDGGYIIAGQTRSYGAGNWDAYLIKLASNSNIQWQYPFGGTEIDRGNDVIQTSDGGYLLVGETQSFGAGYYDAYLVKTDTLGNETWAKTYGDVGDERALGVIETTDGRYVIVGYTTSFGVGLSDIYLIKTYANGDSMWTKTYGGVDWERGLSLKETPDGGFVIAGFTHSIGAGGADFYFLKVDSSGTMVWQKTLGGGTNDEAYSIGHTSDGGYILTGFVSSFGAGGEDVYIVKTGPDATGVGQTPNPGYSFSLCPGKNPVKGIATISYCLKSKSDVAISIYNLSGRNIKMLKKLNQRAGLHEFAWDLRDHAGKRVQSGIYFVQMKVDNHAITCKMVILD